MKKILLLFVLFLGFSFGANAASEIEPALEIGISVIKNNDKPTAIIIRWKDGTTTTINNGAKCVDVFDETDDGGTSYAGQIC